MVSTFTPITPLFQKGQLVTDIRSGNSGVVLASFYNEFSGQHTYTLRVPGMTYNPMAAESVLKASPSLTAVQIGDMVIADSEQGERHMGPCVGFHEGMLVVRFGDDLFLVNMSRVWRVVVMSSFVRPMVAQIGQAS